MKTQLAALMATLAFAISCGGGGASGPEQAQTNLPNSNVDLDVDITSQVTQSEASAETRVIVTSSVGLEVDNLREAYIEAGQLARTAGGFVAQANLSDQDERDSATLRMRVPAFAHDDVLNRLRSFQGAKVRGEETNAKEISAEYADLQSRIRNLQRSESQYQDLMTRAQSVSEIIQVSAKLDEVRGQIEQTQGRLNLLDDQTDLATINVSLSTSPPGAASGLASPVRVLGDALEVSWIVARVAVNILVVLAVAAVWIVPLGLVSLLTWRLFGAQLRALATRLLSW